MNRDDIISDIILERGRQDRLKDAGRFRYTLADKNPGLTDAERFLALTEEIGEVARCVLEDEDLTFDKEPRILFEFQSELHRELTQVAALAVAWMEAL